MKQCNKDNLTEALEKLGVGEFDIYDHLFHMASTFISQLEKAVFSPSFNSGKAYFKQLHAGASPIRFTDKEEYSKDFVADVTVLITKNKKQLQKAFEQNKIQIIHLFVDFIFDQIGSLVSSVYSKYNTQFITEDLLKQILEIIQLDDPNGRLQSLNIQIADMLFKSEVNYVQSVPTCGLKRFEYKKYSEELRDRLHIKIDEISYNEDPYGNVSTYSVVLMTLSLLTKEITSSPNYTTLGKVFENEYILNDNAKTLSFEDVIFSNNVFDLWSSSLTNSLRDKNKPVYDFLVYVGLLHMYTKLNQKQNTTCDMESEPVSGQAGCR